MDYESVSTVVTFGVGTTFDVTCPQISLINDAIAESDETFQIQIATASCQVPQNTFTITIQGIAKSCALFDQYIKLIISRILCTLDNIVCSIFLFLSI